METKINLPNLFSLNDKEWNRCMEILKKTIPQFNKTSFAESLTAVAWLMIVILELSLEANTLKSKSDVIWITRKLFKNIENYFH